MNIIAAVLVMLWLTGWTLASLRVGLKARDPGRPARCRAKELPGSRVTGKGPR